MLILLTGIIIVISIHLIPSFPTLRTKLINRLGEWLYKGLFSIVSIAGLIFIILGWQSAAIVSVWEPPVWSRYLALTIMPVCFIFIIAAYMPSNIKRFTPHPMLWGIVILAAVHLTANGDLASIILFSSFGLYALLDIWIANKRDDELVATVYPITKDAITMVCGLIMYSVILYVHPYLFDVAVI